MKRVSGPFTTLVVVGLLLLLALPGRAQERSEIGAGKRVRIITTTSDSIIGTFMAVRGDALVIQASDERERLVPRAVVSSLEVSLGRQSRVRVEAIRGFFIGALGSAPFLFVACVNTYDCPPHLLVPAYSIGVGVLGAGVGAIIGAFSPRELWEIVSPESLSGRP